MSDRVYVIYFSTIVLPELLKYTSDIYDVLNASWYEENDGLMLVRCWYNDCPYRSVMHIDIFNHHGNMACPYCW